MKYDELRLGDALALVIVSLFAAACSSDDGDASTVSEGSGGNGTSGVSGQGGGPGVVIGGAAGNSATAGRGGGSSSDPCARAGCGPGQRCEMADGKAECTDNSCDELACASDEECVPVGSGGNVCESLTCSTDVECSEERYCDAGVCVDDQCVPDARRCSGSDLVTCASNGGEERTSYRCESLGPGRFPSECSETATGVAGCTCEDDWDCPEFTLCEAGVCSGKGVAPTCTVLPAPFDEVLPQLEFRWGGMNAASPAATGKAFPWSAQVTTTPLVVNLDDDNGDGRINELDFPELVFITYHDAEANDGVVRAVHAGGPRKGEDYFALCGAPGRPPAVEATYSDAFGAYWSEGATLTTDCDDETGDDSRTVATALGGSTLAAGDLDADGTPEIVVAVEQAGILILNNRGEVLVTESDLWDPTLWRYATLAIANLDFEGRPEIILGDRVLTLTETGPLGIERVLIGGARTGVTSDFFGPVVCLADLTGAPGLEIVAGTSLYAMPPRQADCAPPNDSSAYCQNELVQVWNAEDVAANAGEVFDPEGYCAVADVLGSDPTAAPSPANELDGVPEVIVVANGHVLILRADELDGVAGGTLLRNIAIPDAGVQGGAPNVDDFDGDGFPEIATALASRYAVVDLQDPDAENCPAWPALLASAATPPGGNPERTPGGGVSGTCTDDDDCNPGAVCGARTRKCVCLHNGWMRDTEDDSSRVTSSSVFDFNGDGAAEVAYADECYFRVYRGSSGAVEFEIPSLSRTVLENPVVADVDNDGNAEIVIVQNNETLQCNEDPLDSWPRGENDTRRSSLPNGVEVWGDPSDGWVAARRIWNQHGYHVTNVLEDGGIPQHEPESFRPLHGRLYNTYRSQPRSYDVAPDLTLSAIQVSSPDTPCGELSDEIVITVLVQNQGDLRVGPGVTLEFVGVWSGEESALLDADGEPLTIALTTSLEPGASTLVTTTYTVGNNPPPNDAALPDDVRARIDGGNGATGAARECNEENNEILGFVAPGQRLADLELEITDAACDGELSVEVTNVGSRDAEAVLVEIYAGDPSAGGELLGEATIDGPIAPGDSSTADLSLGSFTRALTVWGIADPANAIAECNDANNLSSLGPLDCNVIPE